MLTIEEIDAVEKMIAFREAGNDPRALDSLEKLQQFFNMTDYQLERHIDYFKRAISKHYSGKANYPRLAEEIKEYARRTAR